MWPFGRWSNGCFSGIIAPFRGYHSVTVNHWNANASGIHTWISATNNQNGTGNQLDLRQSSCRKVWIQSHFSHTVLVRYTCDHYLLRSFLKVLEHLERYSFGNNGFDFTLLSWTLYRLSISYIDVFYSFPFLFLVFDGFWIHCWLHHVKFCWARCSTTFFGQLCLVEQCSKPTTSPLCTAWLPRDFPVDCDDYQNNIILEYI